MIAPRRFLNYFRVAGSISFLMRMREFSVGILTFSTGSSLGRKYFKYANASKFLEIIEDDLGLCDLNSRELKISQKKPTEYFRVGMLAFG